MTPLLPRTTALLATRAGDSRLDARIASYELAAQLQLTAPDVLEGFGFGAALLATAAVPIIAERSMYFGTRLFEGGHESAGVPGAR